jgi:hypothetical protein
MDISDQELFNTALTEEAVEQGEVQTEQSVVETEEAAVQQRDEQGRFASRQAEQAQIETQGEQPAGAGQQPQSEGAHVPSWRLREERERAEAAERRFQEAQAQWQRHLAELQSRLPKQEPQAPDPFERPSEFLEHGLSQAVSPIKSQLGQLTEFYSRRDAIREHGQETVNAAYKAIADGLQSRDPEAVAAYQRAMQSMDPFGDIVTWHQQRAVFQQIGKDPNAWFEKHLEERMKDPAFAGSLLGRIQQGAATSQPNGSAKPIVKLPPSLNKVASAQGAAADDGDMSDDALFAHAMR